MNFKQSELRKKRITIDGKQMLVYENDITEHKTIKQTNEFICFDVSSMPIGRVASLVANVLNNKYDYDYSGHIKYPYQIALYNCDQFILTGNKMEDKTYTRYTGYQSGQRTIKFTTLYSKNIRTCFEQVIRRMLNENRSRQSVLNRIKYFSGNFDSYIKKTDSIVQKTVDTIISTYKEKRNV